MGNTNFQRRLFTAIMCFFMVLGMTIYNIILHSGFGSHLFVSLVKEMWMVYIIAFILDMFLVGPLAKKFVFTVLKPKNKIQTILSISSSMVVCMVTLMSVFGSIMNKGFTADALSIYPTTWIRNFIVALPYNILIVSPLVRAIFTAIFPELKEKKEAA